LAGSTAEILIVEDDEVIMGTLAYNLSRQGFGVSQATTGAEALRMARKMRPDLILLDLMLPGESGIQVCERIRERDQDVVIIMITAKDAEEDKVRGFEAGADDYVTKPFGMKELIARLNANLKRSEMAQYLLMGASVRQHLPFDGKPSFSDVNTSSPAYAYAESAVATGGALRDLTQSQAGVMGLLGGKFRPNDTVTRVSLAYSLVQSLALQDEAQSFQGELTAFHNGQRIPLADAGSIPMPLRGYVQLALDHGLINARFTLTQGPYDLEPTLQAWFDPARAVTRAAYAVAAGRYLSHYQSAQD